jgi:hypothetical protein
MGLTGFGGGILVQGIQRCLHGIGAHLSAIVHSAELATDEIVRSPFELWSGCA